MNEEKSPAFYLSQNLEGLLREKVRRYCGGMTPIQDAFFFQKIDKKGSAIWCAGEIDGARGEICDVLCLIVPRVEEVKQ